MFGNFAKLDSPRRLVQFWQNLQTSRVLLIPNCTRQRMITYTNSVLSSVLQYFSSVLQYFSWVLQYLIHQHANFALQVLAQYSKFGNVIRNIQNKLGKRALKSDLKSTVTSTMAVIKGSVRSV